MCGILGILDRKGASPRLPEKALATLRHRGPDGQGLFHDAYTALGHTRLSIIDLSDAAGQPMAFAGGRYQVVFNGEIYNYLELRKELLAAGERFATTSDTEVILAAYRVWGETCVRRFRGMFAFALWDAREQRLFLARDRCGERPLLFYRSPDRFVFASELKALLPLLPSRPDLSLAVVDQYLHYQYVPEPRTLLVGVAKLPAAHTLTLTPGRWDVEPQRYWNIEDSPASEDPPRDTPTLLARIRDTLEEAVTLTLRADVPVGVALSGGIDSGAIAALAQKHSADPMHAFCVGYPGRPHYDERAQARALGERLGMIIHEVELPVDSFVSFFPELVRMMDEPIADPAAFGHFSVPKAAHDHGIKVLLTGIGGDELFWGYHWVTGTVGLNRAAARLRAIPAVRRLLGRDFLACYAARLADSPRVPPRLREAAAMVRNLGRGRAPADQLLFYETAPDFSEAFFLKEEIYGPAMRALPRDNPFVPTAIGPRDSKELPAAAIRLIFDTWMASNSLTLGDRVSMGTSVEARLPFLDVVLIETVMGLRRAIPDHRLGQKAWLRAALKGVLPDEVLVRPKAGFQPPVAEWLQGAMARYGHRLDGGALTEHGVITREAGRRIPTELTQQGWTRLFFAYKVLLLEMWYREVVLQ